MVLSDKQILTEKENGNVVISPFTKENLNTSSYDVTLGPFFYREQPTKHFHNLYNIYQKSHVEHVWGKLEKAEKASIALQKINFRWDRGISTDDEIIILQPGETILAHTQEFIGGKHNITTQMQARSSMGRNFIEVCKCAGWGDVGYINRWTMEITNNSRFYAIPLVVGKRIAQIVFLETYEILKDDYTKNGKYSKDETLEECKKNWYPNMMLPKLYKEEA